MWKIIPYSILQCFLLTGGQVFLKLALTKMPPFSWSIEFWNSLFRNWNFALCGICFGIASLLWMYIIKVFPLSIAYPLTSMSYVFGMFAALFFFHESVSVEKWIGVFFIMLGCCLIAK